MKHLHHLLIIILVCFSSQIVLAQTTVTYQPIPEDFPNPERGFYRATSTTTSNFNPLNQTNLENFRNQQTPFNANYGVKSTLIFRYYILDNFTDSPISTTALQLIGNDFNTARAAGVKLVPRFSYINSTSSSGCSGDICPPYGDAPKNIILNHISQLQPIFQTHNDVIASVQMGFIGIWGEQYYSDHFGDASQAPDYKLTDQNWLDRNEVLVALLAAVPADKMIQVRYPQIKQRFIYGVNAPTTSSPLTAVEAYSGSDKSRIGFHNDCFMASFSDFGTYVDYGNSSTPSNSDTTNLRAYHTEDSRYVVVGGETCSDDYSPQNDCASTNPQAYADTDLERMHYSYMNADYNQEVNNDWQTGGCMEDIKRRLGYRFELTNGTFSDQARPGTVVNFNLGVRNMGYAAPYNQRRVEVILRHNTTGTIHYAYVNDDPRSWEPATTTTISHSLCLPPDLPTGTYSWLLALPDPQLSLEDNPLYNIRIASSIGTTDTWEASTGYHNLGASLEITNSGPGNNCSGELLFTSSTSPLPVNWLGFSASWSDNHALLNWTTENEVDNRGFTVERALDGRSFTHVGWVPAHTTEANRPTYTYVDTEVSPNQSYYYRLRQEDVDGTINYSVIRQLNAQGDRANEVTLFPNPTSGILYFSAPQLIKEVVVIDATGRIVRTYDTIEQQADLSTLTPGIYFVRYRVAGKLAHQRVIVN